MISGDTRNFNFKIKKDGQYIDGSVYTEVEVQFNRQGKHNSIKKTMSNGEVAWDSDHFSCFLSQEDTFNLTDGLTEVQVRLYLEGNVKGTLIKHINVGRVLSKEVL